MAQSEQIQKKSYLNSQNVEIGKFTACCRATSGTFSSATATGSPGYFRVPTIANDGPVAGIAMDSLLPFGFADYQGGTYLAGGSVPPTGTSWPAGALPSSAIGLALNFAVSGIYRAIASTNITVGATCFIADANGRIGPSTGVTAGAVVYEVGIAESAATQANDVFRIRLTMIERPATTGTT
jgi:hypothetical protein